jgi:stearoyl-CoA desaturase (delta-9 desaturase)
VVWQHNNYFLVLLTFGLIVPAVVASFWGDFFGGLVYAGILRIFVVQQATFCINSLAHWLGDQPFDDRDSPRNNWVSALVTFGEGYHNFHHQFPVDYRKQSCSARSVWKLRAQQGTQSAGTNMILPSGASGCGAS